ncbi:MAG: chitobiase/beta-hexosaminidase C-terminal domain-containing protein [Bacteroidales bacterium]|nr:chitobiase/beta-hexosaminidase C-terminal domain-containing protein [Bacteroidales bacterium]
MKKISLLLLLCSLVIICSEGNCDNLDEEIVKNKVFLKQSYNDFNQNLFFTSKAQFERLLSFNKKIYLLNYYIALSDLYISLTKDSKDEKEKYLNQGIELLEESCVLNKDFSESYVLLAYIYNLKVSCGDDPVSLMKKATVTLKTAEKIAPNNPRLYYLRGISNMYTPEVFGGGLDKALADFNLAILNFKKYKITDNTLPDWGFDETYYYMAQIYERQNDIVKADFYYSKSFEINPNFGLLKNITYPKFSLKRFKGISISPLGGEILPDNNLIVVIKHLVAKEIRYTLDGSDPEYNSSKYTSPITIDKSCVLKVRAFFDEEHFTDILSANYVVKKLVDNQYKLEKSNFSSGLSYSYYEETWKNLPDFKLYKEIKSSTVKGISLDVRKRESNFGIVYNGFLEILEGDAYCFYLTSDDGSKLYIDDELVIVNDGIHDSMTLAFQKVLSKGKHKIRLEYFQRGADMSLKLEYESKKIKRQVIPNSFFLY